VHANAAGAVGPGHVDRQRSGQRAVAGTEAVAAGQRLAEQVVAGVADVDEDSRAPFVPSQRTYSAEATASIVLPVVAAPTLLPRLWKA